MAFLRLIKVLHRHSNLIHERCGDFIVIKLSFVITKKRNSESEIIKCPLLIVFTDNNTQKELNSPKACFQTCLTCVYSLLISQFLWYSTLYLHRTPTSLSLSFKIDPKWPRWLLRELAVLCVTTHVWRSPSQLSTDEMSSFRL